MFCSFSPEYKPIDFTSLSLLFGQSESMLFHLFCTNMCCSQLWSLYTICVVLVFATVESNFNTGLLYTNENYHSMHLYSIHSLSG